MPVGRPGQAANATATLARLRALAAASTAADTPLHQAVRFGSRDLVALLTDPDAARAANAAGLVPGALTDDPDIALALAASSATATAAGGRA